MQQNLINHSPDLQKLADEGYELEIINGQFLVVHQIPYVNSEKLIKYGSIVCALTLASPARTGKPADHTAYFIGETPCCASGKPLDAIINNSQVLTLADGLEVNHFFSSKPASGNYDNFYDKIRTYASILSSQAQSIDITITARPHRQKSGIYEKTGF